ncbi:MAG: sigma-70 family RNA polymerase sigma factor, partial [Coriobacteriia bacterium]|nr:sigma-70 family RNA polymerase sigma factor [Coriobacteriia bacterium]
MSDELAAVSPSKKTIIEDLARRSTHGDREALLQLCQIIARDILFKVMRKLPNRMDAEDVAQEVLIRVCSRIHELRDPKSFPYWLNSIVKNETNRYLTVTVKEAPVLDIREYLNSAEEESADLLPQEHISRKEDSEAVMQIVDTLPERQLEAIMLHYYDGMSVTETAKAMGVTKQGASRYLSLARDKIRRGLENRAASQTNIDNSHAAVPFGILITQAMQVGASQVLPDSSPWMTQVLDKCLEYAFVVGAGTLASAFSLK